MYQILFVASLLTFSWLAMMAVHEAGHVVGAVLTGGRVERVVLNPLTISRTDVSPNPNPFVVVWMGPVVGCLIPLIVAISIPHRATRVRHIALFFAGFCLVANGSYIALGSFDGIGDCGVMIRSGSPRWTLLAFGALTIPFGLSIWHRAGSLSRFLADPSRVQPRTACIFFFAVAVLVIGALTCSPR